MHSRMTAIFSGLAIVGLSGVAKAIPVDLELSLVIDSSGSINSNEFSQQIDGYAAAFRQTDVIDSIVNAPNGIAINTILFATNATEVIPFRQLETANDVLTFADDLADIDRINGRTDIQDGIDLAVATLNENDFESENVIIDVSGDGEQNENGDPAAARDAALEAGISRINAITIGESDVFDFYEANVIGGENAFILQAESFDEFDAAIVEKISIEVNVADPVRAPLAPSVVSAPGAIGLIGVGALVMGWSMRRRRKL